MARDCAARGCRHSSVHDTTDGITRRGVEADLFVLRFDEVGRAKTRQNATRSCRRGHGRSPRFKAPFLEAYAAGTAHRPEIAFGNVVADVLERCDPDYRRTNFCGLVLGSKWAE